MKYNINIGDTHYVKVSDRRHKFSFAQPYVIYNPNNFRPNLFLASPYNMKIENGIGFTELINSKICKCLLLEKKQIIYIYE